jgi:triosephosphate isomerase (TIM)
MAARQPLIAGNWKMNGLRADGVALAEAVAKGAGGLACGFVVCPPATLLAPVAAALAGSRVGLGGQDCHAKAKGAHTGDISAAMLADIGCSHVIVGHSERRSDHGEDDAAVNAKALAAQAAGLTAIVCVGESEAERDSGRTLDVVGRQVRGSLPAGATAANTVVAYEPVWAIGSGRTPTPAQIQEVHAHIRAAVAACLGAAQADAVRLLYGGSVKPGNAAEILALQDVDGALVGGASLVAEDFLAIGKSCP